MSDTNRESLALERFLDELQQDSDIPAPPERDLDPAMARWARRMMVAEQSARPDPEQEAVTAARVWQRVLADARPETRGMPDSTRILRRNIQNLATREPRVRASKPHGLWVRAGLVAAVLLVVTGVGLLVASSRTPAANAQEIIDHARVSATAPTAAGVQTMTWVRQQRVLAVSTGRETRTETASWFAAPNRWRNESFEIMVAPDGRELNRATRVEVGDGTDVWSYDLARQTVTVNSVDPRQPAWVDVVLFGENAGGLDELFGRVERCFAPRVTGNERIAGRATYVIDLGVTKCPIAGSPEDGGRRVVWVDAETFFVLKQELYDLQGSRVIDSSQVTSIQYNVAIDPARLVFAPPAGAAVADNRPKPAPSAGEFQQQLARIAQQAAFPVFTPANLPAGLAPRQPRLDPTQNGLVEISFFPTREPDKESLASRMQGITLQEQPATTGLVKLWTDGAEPTTIGGYRAWLRRGVRNPDNTGMDSTVYVLRDGVLISVSSFTISVDELVTVADGLQPVPGSHPPLPDPAP